MERRMLAVSAIAKDGCILTGSFAGPSGVLAS
jgi:hypothetical protein